MLQYDQRNVIVWKASGNYNITFEGGMGEPVYLLRISGNTSNATGADYDVKVVSPDGSALDRTLFTLSGVSSTKPINWRLLDESHLHLINGDETVTVSSSSGASEGVTWSLEVWAIRVRDTQYGRQGGPRV